MIMDMETEESTPLKKSNDCSEDCVKSENLSVFEMETPDERHFDQEMSHALDGNVEDDSFQLRVQYETEFQEDENYHQLANDSCDYRYNSCTFYI